MQDLGNHTARERDLLRELVPLVGERGTRERKVADEYKAATDAAELEYRRSTQSVRDAAERELAAMEQKYGEVRADLAAQLDTEVQGAIDTRDSELRTFAQGTAEIERAARDQAEEARWLADTVGESTVRKATHDFESTSKWADARAKELDELMASAATTLQKKGLPALAQVETSTTGTNEGNADGTDGVGREAVERAMAECAVRLGSLHASINPFLVRAEGVALVLVLAGLLGAGVTVAIDPPTQVNGQTMLRLLAGLGIGVVAGLVLILVFRVWNRGRVAPASRKLAEAEVTARAALAALRAESVSSRDAMLGEVDQVRDREIGKAKKRLGSAREKYEHRRRVEEPALKSRLNEAVEVAHRRRTALLAKVENDFQAARAARLAKLEQDSSQAAAAREASLARARDARDAASAELMTYWKREGERLLAASHGLADHSSHDQPGWAHVLARPARPSEIDHDLIRFGWLDVNLTSLPGWHGPKDGAADPMALSRPLTMRLPAQLDLRGRGSLLLHTTPESRDAALSAVRAVMLRLLTQLPPGKVRYTIFDPVGLGQSFAGFMHLSDHEPLLVGDRIWTEPKHFEQKLADLTEHMEQVIQKYLRNQFASIQEYNREAGEIAEPFRFLIVADFPSNFNEAAAKRLASIISSGPRCGVFTIIATDTRTRPPAWLPLADIERGSIVLDFKKDRFVIRDDDLSRWPLELEAPPEDELFTKIIHRMGTLAKEGGRVQVPFAAVSPGGEQMWTRDSSRELAVPIGRSGATKIQQLVLGRGTAQHALIAGRTGSGKSTLLHAIITSLALWYRPEQCELYLVDFKKGVEFKAYANARLPHARVIAVESEREFGLSVLRKLDTELTRRGQIFRELGVQDLAGYRAANGLTDATKAPAEGAGTTDPMPRVMLIVDEFQEFFIEDDKLAQEAMLLLDRLVRQGRAFGMHVVLGSQTIGGAYSLARTTIGQMAVRVALQCSESDSYLILSEDNPAARLLTRPGEAIYNDASGLLEGNSPFQVVWLPDEVRDERLREVRERAIREQVRVPAPIIFEGNVPSNLLINRELLALLSGSEAPGKHPPRVWMGEAVSIKEPTRAVFRPQSAANMVIVGQSERAALGLMIGAVIALCGWASSYAGTRLGGLPRLTLLDGPSPESEGESALLSLSRRLPNFVRHVTPRHAEEAIAALSQELDRRRLDEHGEHEPVFCLVHGLHRFRALRKAEDDYGFGGGGESPTKPDQQFARLLREGPALGMHTIVWCDNVANLERAIDRRGVKEFDFRVLFQMSGNDSSALIDLPHAASLGANRAMLYSEELGQFEKFRPYAPPGEEALETLLKPLVSESGHGAMA